MKKHLINFVFYTISFLIVVVNIFKLSFYVPPQVGEPGYSGYYWGTIIFSIAIGLFAIVPSLLIEYMVKK